MSIRKKMIIHEIVYYIILFLLFGAGFALVGFLSKLIWLKILFFSYSILMTAFLLSVSFVSIKAELLEIKILQSELEKDLPEITTGDGCFGITVIIPRKGLLFSIPERYRFLEKKEWEKMRDFLFRDNIPNACIKLIYKCSKDSVKSKVLDSYYKYDGVPVFM